MQLEVQTKIIFFYLRDLIAMKICLQELRFMLCNLQNKSTKCNNFIMKNLGGLISLSSQCCKNAINRLNKASDKEKHKKLQAF